MKEKILKISLVLCILAASYTAGLLLGGFLYKDEPNRVDRKPGAIVRLVSENGSTFCTGTVIGKHTVLTAAHCVVLESLFGEPAMRTNIGIRPANNRNLGVTASVHSIRSQMDQAILKGDFSAFSEKRYVQGVSELTILRDKSKLTACGYPLGGELFCGPLQYVGPDIFFWKVRGVLIPGMSGGPTMTENGTVIATNVAVTGEFSVISPIYNLDLDINKQEK